MSKKGQILDKIGTMDIIQNLSLITLLHRLYPTELNHSDIQFKLQNIRFPNTDFPDTFFSRNVIRKLDKGLLCLA
jgi:hypothetical protein